jgi:hypothetical protein
LVTPLREEAAQDGYDVTLNAPNQSLYLAVSGHDVGVFIDASLIDPTPLGNVIIWGSGFGTITSSPTAAVSFPFAFSFEYNGQVCRGGNGRFTLVHS